jgi:hypothetical protein
MNIIKYDLIEEEEEENSPEPKGKKILDYKIK